ncbi:hypothetical protein HYU11_01800 [Candidatus Woesearchaeota archaeon]|nr:hypothetical protein [Candidatus Woesearchaeota archaeon]
MDDTRKWIEKVQATRKDADLSSDEDLSIALMNLISLEEHSYFSSMKTGNTKYLEMMNSVRELRKTLLKRIVKNPEGEEWCMSKHLLAASMRLIEVGTKEQTKGNKGDAEMLFNSAFHLYSLFFAINYKLVGMEEIKKEPEQKSVGRFSMIVKKLLDCCKE